MSPKKRWYHGMRRAFLAGFVIEELYRLKRRTHLFGTQRRLLDKWRGSPKEGKCKAINPENKWKRGWDLMIGVVLVYLAFGLPIQLAFVESQSQVFQNLDLTIDCLFIVDVVISFFTGFRNYEQGGAMVLSIRVTAKKYATG